MPKKKARGPRWRPAVVAVQVLRVLEWQGLASEARKPIVRSRSLFQLPSLLLRALFEFPEISGIMYSVLFPFSLGVQRKEERGKKEFRRREKERKKERMGEKKREKEQRAKTKKKNVNIVRLHTYTSIKNQKKDRENTHANSQPHHFQ